MKQLIVDYIPFEVAPEAINEAMSSNGKLIVKGVLQRAEAKNQNGRVYPMELLQREAKKYTGNFIKEKRALEEWPGGLSNGGSVLGQASRWQCL